MDDYFHFTKSNIIITESFGTRTIAIKNAEAIGVLLADIQMRDCFKIRGAGMLGIRMISIHKEKIDFYCYPIDISVYY